MEARAAGDGHCGVRVKRGGEEVERTRGGGSGERSSGAAECRGAGREREGGERGAGVGEGEKVDAGGGGGGGGVVGGSGEEATGRGGGGGWEPADEVDGGGERVAAERGAIRHCWGLEVLGFGVLLTVREGKWTRKPELKSVPGIL